MFPAVLDNDSFSVAVKKQQQWSWTVLLTPLSPHSVGLMDITIKSAQLNQIEMFYLACQVNFTVMLPHLL